MLDCAAANSLHRRSSLRVNTGVLGRLETHRNGPLGDDARDKCSQQGYLSSYDNTTLRVRPGRNSQVVALPYCPRRSGRYVEIVVPETQTLRGLLPRPQPTPARN